MGRWLARAVPGALAGRGAAWQGYQRYPGQPGLAAHLPGRRRRAGYHREGKKGISGGEETFKVHLDGFDQGELLSGKGPSKRKVFMYISDDGELLAARYERWKTHFMVQRASGIDVWLNPFTPLRAPKLFHLHANPFERGDEGLGYYRWLVEHAFVFVPIQALVLELGQSLRSPPRQKAASFSVDR